MSERMTEAKAVAHVCVEVRLPRPFLGSCSMDEVRIKATREAIGILREKLAGPEYSIREVRISAVLAEVIE